jgi:hypothetical protein
VSCCDLHENQTDLHLASFSPQCVFGSFKSSPEIFTDKRLIGRKFGGFGIIMFLPPSNMLGSDRVEGSD